MAALCAPPIASKTQERASRSPTQYATAVHTDTAKASHKSVNTYPVTYIRQRLARLPSTTSLALLVTVRRSPRCATTGERKCSNGNTPPSQANTSESITSD